MNFSKQNVIIMLLVGGCGIALLLQSCRSAHSEEYNEAVARIEKLTPEQFSAGGVVTPAFQAVSDKAEIAMAKDPLYAELKKKCETERQQLRLLGEKILADNPTLLEKYRHLPDMAKLFKDAALLPQDERNIEISGYFQQKRVLDRVLLGHDDYAELQLVYDLDYEKMKLLFQRQCELSDDVAIRELRDLTFICNLKLMSSFSLKYLATFPPVNVDGSKEFKLAMAAVEAIRKNSEPAKKGLLTYHADNLLKVKLQLIFSQQDEKLRQLQLAAGMAELNISERRYQLKLATRAIRMEILRSVADKKILFAKMEKVFNEDAEYQNAMKASNVASQEVSKFLEQLIAVSNLPEAVEYRKFQAALKVARAEVDRCPVTAGKPLDWSVVLVKTKTLDKDFIAEAKALFMPKFQKENPAATPAVLALPWEAEPNIAAIKAELGKPENKDSLYFVFFLRSALDKVNPNDADNRTALFKLAEKIVYEQPLTRGEAYVVFRHFPAVQPCERYDKFIKLTEKAAVSKNIDPWLQEMLVAVNAFYISCQARGNGWASSVSEKGWQDFGKYQQEAKQHYLKAIELAPDYPNAYVSLLSIANASGGCSDGKADVLKCFHDATSRQADYKAAYFAVLNAFRPRWGGSPEMSYALAIRCFDSPFQDSKVPEYGVWAAVSGASEDSGYRWQRGIRKDMVLSAKMKASLSRRYGQAQTAENRDDIRVQQISLEAALGDYDQAKKMYDEITPVRFAAAQKRLDRVTDGLNTKLNYFSWLDYPAMLAAFTGANGKELKLLEDGFVNGGKDEALKGLRLLLLSGKLQGREKDFAIDLYGRWRLDWDCTYYRHMFPPWRLASFWEKSPQVVFEAVDVGLSPESVGYNKITPLISALALNGGTDEDFAKLIAVSGKVINSGDSVNWTPLHYATQKQRIFVMQRLLLCGADINRGSRDNTTPLMVAAIYGPLEKVKFLVDSGADPQIKQTTDGKTAIDFAREYKHPDIVAYLEKTVAESAVK